MIARDGVKGATHRAVAVEAGTSLGTATYYFATREELIRNAFEYSVSARLEQWSTLMADLEVAVRPGGERAVGALVNFVADQVLKDRVGFLADLDLACDGSRRPELAHWHDVLGRSMEKQLGGVLSSAGLRSSANPARLLIALMRGLAADEMTRTTPTTRRSLQNLVRPVVASMLS